MALPNLPPPANASGARLGLDATPLLLEDGARIDCRPWALEPFCGPIRRLANLYLRRMDLPVWVRQPGRLTAWMIERGNPYYLKALIIQSRGTPAPFACTNKCARGLGMFTSCRVLAGRFQGSCGCCVWQNNYRQCCHNQNYAGPEPTAADRQRPAEPEEDGQVTETESGYEEDETETETETETWDEGEDQDEDDDGDETEVE